MIEQAEALALLEKEVKEPKRIEHAQAVAGIMATLADLFKSNKKLWYLTGLLHDIDLPATKNNLKLHGIIAQEKLKGLLPRESINAIMAHDTHTGFSATTKIAKALVFADNYINLRTSIGQDLLRDVIANNNWRSLIERWPNKKDQVNLVQEFLGQWPVVIRTLEEAGIL